MVRWKALGALVAATAMVLTSGAAAAAGPKQRDLTVLSFNIHHAEGTDGELDLDRIADVITASGADVAGLQEVDRHYSERSDWADQARELADRLGFHVVFGANIDDAPPAAGEPRVQYGTAILSRYPITESSNVHLPGSPDQEQRGLLHAAVNVRGTPVEVYNTHLAASSQPDRTAQAERVAELAGSAERAVLLGDMNAAPGAPELAPLTDGFTDVWAEVGSGAGGTSPSPLPVNRIDYVFASEDVTPVSARVLADVPAASDHLPVAAEITVG